MAFPTDVHALFLINTPLQGEHEAGAIEVPGNLMIHSQIQSQKSEGLYLRNCGMIQDDAMIETEFPRTRVVHQMVFLAG